MRLRIMKKHSPFPVSRKRALAAIELAKSFIEKPREATDDADQKLMDMLADEGRRLQQQSMSLVLALLYDHYTPAKLFKPWASKKRITQWRDDPKVKLDVIIRHGRLCVKPDSFFAHWRTLNK